MVSPPVLPCALRRFSEPVVARLVSGFSIKTVRTRACGKERGGGDGGGEEEEEEGGGGDGAAELLLLVLDLASGSIPCRCGRLGSSFVSAVDSLGLGAGGREGDTVIPLGERDEGLVGGDPGGVLLTDTAACRIETGACNLVIS